MMKGYITEVQGPVVDVLFPEGRLPFIKDALTVQNGEHKCVMEVAQHMGGNVVRCIMLSPSEGLCREMEVIAEGGGIRVPVGDRTLGRLFNVTGDVIDDGDPLPEGEKWCIHRDPPGFADQSPVVEILETGIKVIDLLAPYAKGGKIGLFGGEGMTEPMRDEMHKVWGDQFVCTQNYGMSELCGPGVAGECTELCGMHINEDWFIPEVIDPETEEVLPPGELGELVVTCLGKEALPLVRYRTGDLTRLMYEPCKCGRTTVRMENLSGRADDMLVIRGVNVFPGQIEEVLFKIDEIGPHYEILVERKNRLDVMTITVELIDDRLLDSYGQLSELENRIKTRLKSQLGLATQIRLVAPNSLQRFEGKAKRVTDLRKDGL